MRLVHLSFFAFSVSLLAQTATLRGVITDESGASVPSATVSVTAGNFTRSTRTGPNGAYVLTGLPAGEYIVQASATSLVLPQPAQIALRGGVRTLDLKLRIAATVQQITVEESAGALSTDAGNNASATVLKGKDLDALSDNPEDLQADLQALAGPAAGPGGGSIFVDGFSGGQLPPKDSIREIRINQNPFSPEYDRLGLGRIEILTKPGTDKFHGSVAYNYMNDVWNSRNPYAAEKAPLRLREFRTNLTGPLHRRTSFTLDVQRDAVDNGSIVNAVTLEPQTLAVTPFTAVPVTPQRRVLVSPRVDYQLDSKNTLTMRYTYTQSDIRDAGIGSFDLFSRAYRLQNAGHTFQATETAVFGTTVNEARFQYTRSFNETIPNLISPTVQVLGSFNGGGAQTGHAFNMQNNYELQNYTTVVHGGHIVKFGIRTRIQSIDTISPQNYNGVFTFAGGLAPQLDANFRPVEDAAGQPALIQIESIERYQRTLRFQQLGYPAAQIRAFGGGASQFRITAGIPGIAGSQSDAGLFVGDDWKARPNLTFSFGLRYEAQTNIHDRGDWAPRIALAWAPGGSGKKQPATVFRAGFGMFYDRFALNNTLNARLSDGILQQQYVITNPDFFPAIPPVSSLAAFQTTQVIRAVDSSLRAPYVMQSSFTAERQLSAGTTVALTYTNSHGLHALRSLDINAPFPGTGLFPFGNPNPLFLMTSSGIYNQNQVAVNVNARVNREISLTGSYTWNRARSNTDGLGTFPANPYDDTGEYGPASNDIRHTVNLNGTIDTKWGLRLSPLLSLQSGAPFDITTGSDLYGTTLFNARPGIARDPNKPGLIATSYGLLDPNPAPGEPVLPRNFGRGPGQIMVNLRLSKTIGFGPERGGNGENQGGGPASNAPPTSRRYNLSISMSARNVLNHTNAGPIIGNIASPLFGRANQMAGGLGGGGFNENADNRRLEMQLRLAF